MWLEATRGHRSQGPVRTPSRALPTLDLNSQLATTRGAHPNPGRTAGRGCFGPGTAPHAARSPPTRGPLAPQALRAGAEPRGPEPGGPGTASIFSLPPGAERGGRGTPAAQSAPPLARPPPPLLPQRYSQPGPLPAGSRSWREAAFWPGATSAVSTIKASGAPIAPGGGTTAAAPKTTASRGRLLRPVPGREGAGT